MFTFLGTCVNLSADEIDAFDDTARTISWRTFKNHVGPEVWKELNLANGVPLKKDWSVSFEKGKWKGHTAVCMHHSSIHHIYVDNR